MAGTARGRFRRATCPIAHGELEAHGGSGEEYGSCVRENDGCRDSRAMVCKEGAGEDRKCPVSVPAPPGILCDLYRYTAERERSCSL